MITTTPHPSTVTNEATAARLAERNWQANLNAIRAKQPRLAEALRAQTIHVSEWIFARDGALTAFTGPGRWWTGCSLPHRAASAMLRSLEVSGVVGCLLDPPHAAHVRVTLDKLRRNQAVIAVCPDLPQLALLLHCDEFAEDLAANRLWFASGEHWPADLARLFEDNPGLPLPSTFGRLPVHDDATVERFISQSHAVFAAESARRASVLKAARSVGPTTSTSRAVAVVTRSHFRLWDDAPTALASAFAAGSTLIDTDDPCSASPLALAAAAEGCDAIACADFARADAPHALPEHVAWITWVTTPRLPTCVASASRDGLLLADPAWRDKALAQGWPADRVAVATWPERTNVPAAPATTLAAFIADTKSLTPPARLEDYSSHRLLWEEIAAELTANPFAAIDDPEGYLDGRRRAAGIDDPAFDRAVFLNDLITPAVAQGLAAALLGAGVPLTLHGRGWAELEPFAACAAGAVTSRDELFAAVDRSAVLIDPRPVGGVHPMNALGRPVVRPRRGVTATAKSFADLVRRAASSSSQPPRAASEGPPFSSGRVYALLRT